MIMFKEYYSNKKCNSIEIIPELESSLLIRNYDLLFKPTSQTKNLFHRQHHLDRQREILF